MSPRFQPNIRTEEELKARQLEGLRWTVRHAYTGSPFYRRHLDAAGAHPDTIQTLDDLRRLPFLTADDLRDDYPFPLLSVPMEDVVRVHASTGTTGRRKVLCYTQKDIEDWTLFFARCYETAGLSREDRVQIAVGYGIWTAGVGFQAACERFGAMAIPAGPGNMDIQCRFLEDFGTTVFCCTASMGLLMGEEVRRRGSRDRTKLNKVIMGSERSSDAMLQRMRELLGVEHIFDITGLTELYGPGTGIDCVHHTGIHYWADYYILEIIDPETLEPTPEGEIGEMVITTLCKEAAPLIRYRTRDLTRLLPGPCPCGSPMPRHDRLIGRSDDMFIYRAVNIYPSGIDEILSEFKELDSEYQVHLDRREDGRDYMTIRVERKRETSADLDLGLAGAVRKAIKSRFLVTSDVEIVDYQSLPRSERKSQRVFDNR
jgi:phenylacetate-CoA ligase